MTGKSIREFARIVGVTEGYIRLKLLSRGTNPAAYYRERLLELKYSELEIAEWFGFFETRIPAKFKKTEKKPLKRIRLIPVKEPLNLDLTEEQTERINRMSQIKRERISFIISVLKNAQEAGVLDAGAANKELNKIIKNKPKGAKGLSLARYKKIVKNIRENGMQKFIDGFVVLGMGKSGKTKISDDDLALFAQAYMSGSQHSVKEAWEYMLGGRDPLKFACAQSFLYCLQKKYGPAQIDYARKGKEYALRNWGASVPRKSEALPCENWIGDAMLFDFLCVGSNGKQTRLWLTAFMDEKSKRFMGYEIHEDAQKVEHILLALYKGISKYRAPEKIIIDNGKTYRSKTFSGGRGIKLEESGEEELKRSINTCARLGIDVRFTTPYNHHGKDIEREFSRLHRGFCRWLLTYFGVDVSRHPDVFNDIQKIQDKEKFMPTIEQVKQLFSDYLEKQHDLYVYKSGENKGKNPLTLWNAGYSEYASEHFAFTERSLILLCSRITDVRTIRGNGILDRRTNTYYWNERFVSMLGKKVYLRVPPDNNDRVYIYDESDAFVCCAGAVERIAKITDDREKLSNSISRVKTVNKEISKHKNDFKNTQIPPETAFERISASRKAAALLKGLDVEEVKIETNTVYTNDADKDVAQAKAQEDEGTARLPEVSPLKKDKIYLGDWEKDYEPLDYEKIG